MRKSQGAILVMVGW